MSVSGPNYDRPLKLLPLKTDCDAAAKFHCHGFDIFGPLWLMGGITVVTLTIAIWSTPSHSPRHVASVASRLKRAMTSRPDRRQEDDKRSGDHCRPAARTGVLHLP